MSLNKETQTESLCKEVTSFASQGQPLTKMEQRYLQIGNVCLTVVCRVEHFHLFAASFILITDHQPLIWGEEWP